MSWIKITFAQLAVVFILLNILALPLLWLGWKVIPYSDAFNSKWIKQEKSSFNYPHPYLGYTKTNNHDFPQLSYDENLIWDSFQTGGYDIKRDPTILIVGGSVASHISNNQGDHENNNAPIYGRHIFSKTLLSLYPEKEFRVINAAYGGKKQPQQYFTAIYLDLIGVDYNLVINIDGFNEIALPITENYQQGIPGIFPRSYFKKIEAFHKGMQCMNTLKTDVTFLPFLDFFNSIRKRMCLVSIANPDNTAQLNFRKNSFQEYMADVQAIWARTSNKLNSFLSAKKKEYIHVIQPNQYLVGSKPLSNEELEYAYERNYPSEIINDYYSGLKTEMIESKNILDLRYLFEKNEATLYRDACCHLNEKGMAIIAQDIVINNKSLFDKMFGLD